MDSTRKQPDSQVRFDYDKERIAVYGGARALQALGTMEAGDWLDWSSGDADALQTFAPAKYKERFRPERWRLEKDRARFNNAAEMVGDIRAEPDADRRRMLKQEHLPATTWSNGCDADAAGNPIPRKAAYLKPGTRFLVYDFDAPPDAERPWDGQSAAEARDRLFESEPSAYAAGLSAGGCGFWLVIALTRQTRDKADHNATWWHVAATLKEKHDVHFNEKSSKGSGDSAPSSIASYRFFSSDEGLRRRNSEELEPFDIADEPPPDSESRERVFGRADKSARQAKQEQSDGEASKSRPARDPNSARAKSETARFLSMTPEERIETFVKEARDAGRHYTAQYSTNADAICYARLDIDAFPQERIEEYERAFVAAGRAASDGEVASLARGAMEWAIRKEPECRAKREARVAEYAAKYGAPPASEKAETREERRQREQDAARASDSSTPGEQARLIFELIRAVRGVNGSPITPEKAVERIALHIGEANNSSPRAALLRKLADDVFVTDASAVEPHLDAWNTAGLIATGDVDEPAPEPVLWVDHADGRSPLCSVGEPMILSAPGQSGKTYLALGIGIAAAGVRDEDYGDKEVPSVDAIGFKVRSGRVLLWSYEESRQRLASRVETLTRPRPTGFQDAEETARWATARKRLYFLKDHAPPIWEPRQSGRGVERSTGWHVLTGMLATLRPTLLFIDAASGSMGGADMNDGAAVASVMRDLALLSEATGVGIVVIAHDTKASRADAKTGAMPGEGAIAGSAQWFDRARGCVYLQTGAEVDGAQGARTSTLIAHKCNHGQGGFAIEVVKHAGSNFRGYEFVRFIADYRAERSRRQKAEDETPQPKKKTREQKPASGTAADSAAPTRPGDPGDITERDDL